jgi:hypothetical protein
MKKNRTFNSFEDWHSIDIERKLNVCRTNDPQILQQLQPAESTDKAQIPISELEKIRIELQLFHSEWNEQELFAHHINPMLRTLQWRGENYNLFHERFIKGKVDKYVVSGFVDGLVASGLYEPEIPFFFLHEYKRFKGTDADPLGQLLIAMVIAQTVNPIVETIYGCYIVGKFWQFVVLQAQQFAETQGYDATDSMELQLIWLHLLAIQQKIIQLVMHYQNQTEINLIK